MANVIIDVAAEFTGKKAFKDAGNATSSLEKSVKTLGKTIGLTFSAKAIVDFSKASVKAFAEDDRAIRVLRINLKNLGLAYQSANADNFIASMEKQAAISDDLLRPAYAQLSKVTLSTTKTQDLMALAFDLSAANSIDFASTVDILSNAYVGNYKGLKQLYTGLTQAQLATKSFEEIQAILTKQSKGAGKTALNTYAGSVDKLSIAADNAKESIGKGLVDLFANLAGNGDIDQATANIDTFSKALGTMLSDASKYGAIDWLSALVTGNVTEGTAQKLVKRPSARRFFTGGSGVSTEMLAARKQAAADAKAIKDAKALAAAKIRADKLAAANKLQLDKAAGIFNLQNIQIAAALKGKISEEEKVRLLLMQAIIDEDAVKAEELSKKLEDIQKKNEQIAKQLVYIQGTKNPFQAWVDSLTAASQFLSLIGTKSSGTGMPALLNTDGTLTPKGLVNIPTGGDLPSLAEVTTPVKVADSVINIADDFAEASDAIVTSLPSVVESVADILGVAENASIFTPGMTPTEIADIATLAAAAAADIAAILASSITNNDPVMTTSMGSNGGFGFSLPNYLKNTIPQLAPAPVTVNVTGSVIMQDELVKVINDAVVTANTNGYNNYRPGAVLD